LAEPGTGGGALGYNSGLVTVSLTALALIVAASLGWSGFDLLRKVLVQRVAPLPLLFVLTLGQAPLFAVWWLIQPQAMESGYWGPAVLSVLLNVVANVSFLLAIKWSPLHLTIPLLSLIPVLSTLLAIPLLGELPSHRQWLGIGLVVLGALGLHLAGAVERHGFGALVSGLISERGSLMMLVVVLAWSLTLPLDKLAIQAAGVPLHGVVLTVGVALGMLVAMAARRELGEMRQVARAPGLSVLAVVISTLALGLQFLAMLQVYVSLVETLKRGIGNLMALAWGRFLLREQVTVGSVWAVVVMALGVALILV